MQSFVVARELIDSGCELLVAWTEVEVGGGEVMGMVVGDTVGKALAHERFRIRCFRSNES